MEMVGGRASRTRVTREIRKERLNTEQPHREREREIKNGQKAAEKWEEVPALR